MDSRTAGAHKEGLFRKLFILFKNIQFFSIYLLKVFMVNFGKLTLCQFEALKNLADTNFNNNLYAKVFVTKYFHSNNSKASIFSNNTYEFLFFS